MDEILDLQIRRNIYDLIVKNPGLHARKIAEIIGIPGQLADYHLSALEHAFLITSTKEEGNRRFYSKEIVGVKEKKHMAILRKETPLRIVLFLLAHPGSTHGEILAQCPVTKSTISYHLEKLLMHQVITIDLVGSEKHYRVLNEKDIYELLIRYKPYSRIESLKDTWIDLRWP
jgi:predicted transcriptional regulator